MTASRASAAPGGGPVTVTGLAQRRAWHARQFPPVEQVAAGVWSVPVRMPENPLRYTLCYLLLGDAGAIVVDPGWESDAGWADLQRGLAAASLSADRITGIVITHAHIDHHGLSLRLGEASGAWIAMHAEEVQNLPARIGKAVGPDGGRAWLARCGAPAEMMEEFSADLAEALGLYRLAEPDVLLNDGEDLDLPGRRIRVVWTPGHTPGHICLHDADHDLLLTGDHLLPRISPNIGLTPGTKDSPLTSYLQSLAAMRRFAGAEALPAHEYRFRGIAERAEVLVRHHDDRAREVLDVVAAAGQPTVWEVAERLTWSRAWEEITGFMRRAALAETAAHVEYLERAGLIKRRASGRGPVRLAVVPA